MTAAPMLDEPEHPNRPGVTAWPVPPRGGFTADDLERIPDLPPHTELIDGNLVFVSPQALFHMLVLRLFERALTRLAPGEIRICREMTVTLGARQRPEPDLLAVHAEAVRDLCQTGFQPEDVVLAVEIVSRDSEVRDRERKPELYAKAGIPHFWRIENSSGRPVVYAYELDPATRGYVATGIYHDRLKLTVPFDIDIDLTELDRL